VRLFNSGGGGGAEKRAAHIEAKDKVKMNLPTSIKKNRQRERVKRIRLTRKDAKALRIEQKLNSSN
jgi:hypothetical protein